MAVTSISKAIGMLKVKALGEGTTFYASELGLSGGTVASLAYHERMIRPTGNVKHVMVNVYDNYYIDATVKEWEVYDAYKDSKALRGVRTRELATYVDMILEAADFIRDKGFDTVIKG